MKRIVSLLLAAVMLFAAVSALAEPMKVGELIYLNTDNESRGKMLATIESILKEKGGYLFGVDDEIQTVFFDNLNTMQMALESNQIDTMILYSKVGSYLAMQTHAFSVGQKASEYSEPTSTGSENYQMILPVLDQILGTDFAFLLREDDTALRDEFNQAIAAMKEEGLFDKLMNEQFDAVREGKPLEAAEIPAIDGTAVIKVAVTGDLPPMDYIDEEGKPAGFNTAVLAEISKRIGRNIELVSVESGARALALSSGTVDVVFWTRVNKPDPDALNAMPPETAETIRNAMASLEGIVRDATMDVPSGTILTDPYLHDIYMPVYLIR